MIYDIVFNPNDILHKRAAEVDPTTITSRDMQKFFKDMVETMYVKDGVGLAAVQVGVDSQVCTIIKTYNDLNLQEDLVLINPRWEKLSSAKVWDEEGCLSLPGLYGKIKRYTKIKVQAYDHGGKKIKFEATDFFARIIQHECDHLNGHLYAENAKDFHQEQKKKKV